jgi:hypothetical protein
MAGLGVATGRPRWSRWTHLAQHAIPMSGYIVFAVLTGIGLYWQTTYIPYVTTSDNPVLIAGNLYSYTGGNTATQLTLPTFADSNSGQVVGDIYPAELAPSCTVGWPADVVYPIYKAYLEVRNNMMSLKEVYFQHGVGLRQVLFGVFIAAAAVEFALCLLCLIPNGKGSYVYYDWTEWLGVNLVHDTLSCVCYALGTLVTCLVLGINVDSTIGMYIVVCVLWCAGYTMQQILGHFIADSTVPNLEGGKKAMTLPLHTMRITYLATLVLHAGFCALLFSRVANFSTGLPATLSTFSSFVFASSNLVRGLVIGLQIAQFCVFQFKALGNLYYGFSRHTLENDKSSGVDFNPTWWLGTGEMFTSLINSITLLGYLFTMLLGFNMRVTNYVSTHQATCM